MAARKPRALRQGETVRIVAPAGPFDRASFDQGLDILRRRYRPVFDDAIFSAHRYLAGTDDVRLRDLQASLTSPDIRAVFCARGGYGSMRILEKLSNTWPPHVPFVGFSDITAPHAFATAQGAVTFHGPVVTQLGRQPQRSIDRLFRLLESSVPIEPLEGTTTICPGVAEGVLVGGNLSVLTRLLGTRYMPPLEGAVLLLEDVGERPYRLDRMWMHLVLAGVFEKVRGIVLGEFTRCDEPDASYSSTDVLTELVLATGLPCVAGFPIGHGEENCAVPLGVRVRLDAGHRTLEFLEAAVAEEQG